MPNEAVWPQEFTDENDVHLHKTIDEIMKKSLNLENKFFEMIKLLLYRINYKYHLKSEDKIYDFFNEYRALLDTTKTDGEFHVEGSYWIDIYLSVFPI